MAAQGPSDTPEETRRSTLGERLRASEAFADVRDYVRTGLESWERRGVAAVPFRDPGATDRGDPSADDPDRNVSGATAPRRRRRALVAVSLLVVTGMAGPTIGYVVIAGGWNPPGVDGSTGVGPSPASSTDHATHDGADSEPNSSTSRGAGHRTPSAAATGIRPDDPTAPGADPTRPSDPTSSPASSPSSKPDDDDDDDDDDDGGGKPDKPKPTRTRPNKPVGPAAAPPSHAEPGSSAEPAQRGDRQR